MDFKKSIDKTKSKVYTYFVKQKRFQIMKKQEKTS